MFTSVDMKMKKQILAGYGSAALFCFLFQLIYESFSHGVRSWFMVLAFLIPLIGAPVSLAGSCALAGRAGSRFRQLVCGGVIWLTLGSVFQGVLEIYGTTNHNTVVFLIAGLAQLAAAALVRFLPHKAA